MYQHNTKKLNMFLHNTPTTNYAYLPTTSVPNTSKALTCLHAFRHLDGEQRDEGAWPKAREPLRPAPSAGAGERDAGWATTAAAYQIALQGVVIKTLENPRKHLENT